MDGRAFKRSVRVAAVDRVLGASRWTSIRPAMRSIRGRRSSTSPPSRSSAARRGSRWARERSRTAPAGAARARPPSGARRAPDRLRRRARLRSLGGKQFGAEPGRPRSIRACPASAAGAGPRDRTRSRTASARRDPRGQPARVHPERAARRHHDRLGAQGSVSFLRRSWNATSAAQRVPSRQSTRPRIGAPIPTPVVVPGSTVRWPPQIQPRRRRLPMPLAALRAHRHLGSGHSKRSRLITLFQAATKSWTNFSCASELP